MHNSASTALTTTPTPTALITGASSGIGEAMSHSLAQRGVELILLARRLERLEALKGTLESLYPKVKVKLLACDVNDTDVLEQIHKLSSGRVDILINNAGLALGKDKLESAQWGDLEEMIHTNVIANFRLAHGIVPWMLKHGQGDVINLCSVAGHYTYPGGAVYCATKHAVHAFTRVLREEVAGRNVRIMQISPGMVETEFSLKRFKGDEVEASKVYEGMTPLSAQDIAQMMQFMLDRPRHVVIDEIITMPMQQGSPITVVRQSKSG
jgi:3-hydroxy acid dehydrogenase / malonic semialdehyde reductase